MKNLMYALMLATIWGLSSTVNTQAETLTLSPTASAVLPADGSGQTKAVFLFDLSSLPEENCFVGSAVIDWNISAVDDDAYTEYAMNEASESWTVTGIASGTVPGAGDEVSFWDITPGDYELSGDLLRFVVTDVVRAWCDGVKENYGVVMATEDLGATDIAAKLGDAQLIIRYAMR